MALDQRGRIARDGHRFDHVGIERALAQKARRAGPLGRRLKNFDESLADDLPFAFGVGHALEAAQEQLGGVLVLELDFEVAPEHLAHDARLAAAQQTIIDKNAGQPVSDGLVDERRLHAGVHPAAQPQQHALPPHLRPDFLDRLVNVTPHRPVLPAPAHPMNKIGDDLPAVGRVRHLRMELQPEKLPLPVLDRRELRIVRRCHGLEPRRRGGQLVPVRIPHLERIGQVGEERGKRIGHQQGPLAVLPLLPPLHLAVQEMRHDLRAVANPQDRNAQLEDAAIRQGRLGRIDTGRAAGKDQALGIEGRDFLRPHVKAHNG